MFSLLDGFLAVVGPACSKKNRQILEPPTHFRFKNGSYRFFFHFKIDSFGFLLLKSEIKIIEILDGC